MFEIADEKILQDTFQRREKGKIVEESRSTPLPTPIRSPRTHTNLVSSDTEKLQELTETHTQTTSSSRSQHTKLSRANRLLSLFKAKPARKIFVKEVIRYSAAFSQEVMVESLPTMVDTHIKEQVKKQVPEQVRDQVPVYVAEGLILERQKTKEEMERMIAKAILQERGNIQAEISSQIQKAIDNQIPSQVDASVRSYMSGHILHVHPAQTQTLSVPEQQYQLYLSMKDNPQLQQQDIAIWLALQMKFENLQVQQTTCRPSAVRPRDQDDPHDDAHLEGENSAKRQKTSEYFEIVVHSTSKKDQNSVQSWSKSPEPQTYLCKSDLLYWKKGSSRPEKILLSLPCFYAITFNNVDIENEIPDGIGKKEKRVMRHSEIHKFCDATLNRVLEGLKSYNNDVKYGYVQRELTNDEVEYLKLFEEEIEVRLKHRNQMRRWEMYVNGRPLGPQRERPE
ncbi:hypothetical protein Tco_0595478 [Tanacetum coccineum]